MASNRTLTPMVEGKHHKSKGHKGKKIPHDVTPKDEGFSRNFSKVGKPKLNASSDDKKSMGGRR